MASTICADSLLSLLVGGVVSTVSKNLELRDLTYLNSTKGSAHQPKKNSRQVVCSLAADIMLA